jgi:HD-like signal output (HDOD) protein
VVPCPFCNVMLPAEKMPAEGSILWACEGCKNPVVVLRGDLSLEGRPLPRGRDIRAISQPGSIGGEILSSMESAIDALPVLPQISQQMLQLLGDPDSGMDALSTLIQGDQVIALRIMKTANSAAYGGLHEIKDLQSACARLGTKTLANVIQAAAHGSLYVTKNATLRDYMWQLWRHSVATAHAAHELALLLSFPQPERLFLAGLVHDIGKVLLLDILSRESGGVLAPLQESADLRDEILERFHILIGLHVVQHWDMPPDFFASTYCHHDPDLCPDEKLLIMTHIVCLADAIVRVEGFTTNPVKEIFLTSLPSSKFLNMSDIRLAGLRIDLMDKVEALL